MRGLSRTADAHVYVAAGSGGIVRIGVSVNPRRRVRQLEVQNRIPMMLQAAELVPYRRDAHGTINAESVRDAACAKLLPAHCCGEWYDIPCDEAALVISTTHNQMAELLEAGQSISQYLAGCRYRDVPKTSDDIDDIFDLGSGVSIPYTTRAKRVGPSQFVSRNGRLTYSDPELFSRWNNLPYGRWTCADGREVLFSRFYEPLLHRAAGGSWAEADPSEWVRGIVTQEWFYGDIDPEPLKCKKARAALRSALAHTLAP